MAEGGERERVGGSCRYILGGGRELSLTFQLGFKGRMGREKRREEEEEKGEVKVER